MYLLVFVFVKSSLKNSRIQPTLVLEVGERHGWVSRGWPIGPPGRLIYKVEYCIELVQEMLLALPYWYHLWRVKSLSKWATKINQVNSLPNVCKCEGTQKPDSPQRSLPVYKHIANWKHCFCWQILTISKGEYTFRKTVTSARPSGLGRKDLQFWSAFCSCLFLGCKNCL